MRKATAAALGAAVLFCALLALLAARSLPYFLSPYAQQNSLQHLTQAVAQGDGPAQAVSLPHSFTGLAARTKVTVTLTVTMQPGDYLYVKSVYAPLRVYADGVLIYEYGQAGAYPSYLTDPATGVALVALPGTGACRLQLEYLSPAARSTLTVHPLLLGGQAAVLQYLWETLGFTFAFSILLGMSGLFLLLIGAFILTFERSGVAFLWLGLFALSVGCWFFGECNLTQFLVHNPTLLYLMAFIGMFSLPVPLLCFGAVVVNFHNKRPLYAAALAQAAAVCGAMALQAAGILPFSRSMYLFHLLVPLALCAFVGALVRERRRWRNARARQFLLPVSMLALFSVLEALNYRMRFVSTLTSLFQIGVALFVLMTGAIGGSFIRDALRLRAENQRLEYERSRIAYQEEEQEKRQQLLLENQQAIRAQRHDLHHHLAVLCSYAEQGDGARLTAYLDRLSEAIPAEQGQMYCENPAVSAVVAHYSALAQNAETELFFRLDVPAQTGQIPDSVLCGIFGNLLENAVEACARMQKGRRFLRLCSRLEYGTLTITMDNSFDGKAERRGGEFLSSKRHAAAGTGLASIRAAAEKYGGGARFVPDGTVFRCSVYLQTGES